MAEALLKDQDPLCCPVCLDLLKVPVTIQCGHSYCMGCISVCWDQEDYKGEYSCPQCREKFPLRPVLKKSTMLADLVEKLRMTGAQAASSASCYAGPGDVECDLCSREALKAIQSCLVCLVSLCETHIQSHYEVPALQRHKLVKAIRLQQVICPQHGRPLEVFCLTDQLSICMQCTIGEHRDHVTVSAEEERTEKQKQLANIQREWQQRIQEKEKQLTELKGAIPCHKDYVLIALKHSDRIFSELLQSIDKRRSEVGELIRAQQKAAVSGAEEIQEELEQEITELRRTDDELEQLLHVEDHIHFIQGFQALQISPVSKASPSFTISPHLSFDALVESLSALKHKVEELCKEDIRKISEEVTMTDIILHHEPQTREEFLKYSCQLTLDPNTAHRSLSLSEGNRKARNGARVQPYEVHPARFDGHAQVLCEQGLTRRCYWETEWSTQDNSGVDIAVAYRRILRKGWGTESRFGGGNLQSWCLNCDKQRCIFWHNRKYTVISITPSSRIGVYVDHSAGTLSFYNISDTMSLLYREKTTFTEPLYPGFGLEPGASVGIHLNDN